MSSEKWMGISTVYESGEFPVSAGVNIISGIEETRVIYTEGFAKLYPARPGTGTGCGKTPSELTVTAYPPGLTAARIDEMGKIVFFNPDDPATKAISAEDIAKLNAAIDGEKKCACPINTLFFGGCVCGGFQAEQARKEKAFGKKRNGLAFML